jgi:hypothetical protein
MRHAAHETRESDDRLDDVHPEHNLKNWINPSSLVAPPARSGFVQRWVSDGAMSGGDSGTAERNYARKMREGWRPRDPATVPADLRDIYPSSRISNGHDVIRVSGLVLMELPVQAARQRHDAVNDAIRRQSKSIPKSTDELRRGMRESGVGELEVTDSNTSLRGRRAATMVD